MRVEQAREALVAVEAGKRKAKRVASQFVIIAFDRHRQIRFSS